MVSRYYVYKQALLEEADDSCGHVCFVRRKTSSF